MDFKVGDRVRTNDGVEAPIDGFVGWYPLIYQVAGKDYLPSQLKKVESPKPPPSPWLLAPQETHQIAIHTGECGNCGRAISLAAARHLVEELQEQNGVRLVANLSRDALFLTPKQWGQLKKHTGLE